MDEVRVNSWNELQEELYRESWHESLGRHRSEFAFRGTPDATEPLVTTLMRLGGAYHRVEGPLLPRVPQVRAPLRSAGRLRLELACGGRAPRPAHPAARLDLLALDRAALCDG